MKQDMIVIWTLVVQKYSNRPSDSVMGVYSEIHPHDIREGAWKA